MAMVLESGDESYSARQCCRHCAGVALCRGNSVLGQYCVKAALCWGSTVGGQYCHGVVLVCLPLHWF